MHCPSSSELLHISVRRLNECNQDMRGKESQLRDAKGSLIEAGWWGSVAGEERARAQLQLWKSSGLHQKCFTCIADGAFK